MNPLNLTLSVLIFLIVGAVHAQESNQLLRGTEHGNGGDPAELAEFTGRNGERLSSWATVKIDLINGLEADQHKSLDLKGVDPEIFKLRVLKALRETAVEFKDDPIVIEGVERACKNYSNSRGTNIQCNPAKYASEMKIFTTEEQYRLVAHEYFSAAGFEPNSYGLSSYPYSSQVSSSLRNVVVKRWHVPSSQTTDDHAQLSTLVSSCKIRSSSGNWGYVIHVGNPESQAGDIEIYQRGSFAKFV